MKTVFLLAMLLPAMAFAYAGREDEYAPAGPIDPDLPGELPEPSFLETIGLLAMAATRGERNNNPGNIRISSAPWQGKVDGVDPAFETFTDPQAGIRALARVLKNYQAVHGLDTVRGIIGRWAPPTENNTAAYVQSVAGALGVAPDDRINLQDAATLEKLTAAIIRHENGRLIYSAADIAAAVQLA